MSHYGHVFDTDYNPMKERASQVVYQLINEYFDNPIMTKIRDDRNHKHTVYMAKVDCLLGAEYRYIIATIEQNNNQVGSVMDLSKIKWDSFQTRTMEESYDISPQRYRPKRTEEFLRKITVNNRHEDYTTYLCDHYQIKITALHKRKGLYEYPNNGTLAAALETFRTIITFNF